MSTPYNPFLGKNPDLVPISNSEIGTYKECKRKWWLSYYLSLGPKEKKITGPLALGTTIHKCLEELYKNGIDPTETHQEIVQETLHYLTDNELDTTDYVKDAELGRIMLEGYMDWLEESGADSNLEVTDSEKKLSAPLMNGKVELRGKLDLRARNIVDGSRSFLDFKTVQNKETYLKIAHMAEQLKIYILLENMVEDDDSRVDGAIYRLLKKVKRTATAKPPFYEDFHLRHNRKTMENFWMGLHGVVGDMLVLRQQLDDGASPIQVAYPTPSNDCSWKCPFYTACPMFDDGSAVWEYIDDNFEQYDSYQRYEEETK